VRRFRLPNKSGSAKGLKLMLLTWRGNTFDKFLSIILIICILCAVALVVHILAENQSRERFTEFYILGLNSKTKDYPTEFILDNNHVMSVRYGTSIFDTTGELGKVTLGIVNFEQKKSSYAVITKIDGQQVNIIYLGKSVSQLEQIELQQGEKWEQEIGFIPEHAGDNQQVEFLLYRDGFPSPVDTLYLWINAKTAQ